ncbi:hypothetical protein MATL_G00123130 [Megalops atlanticus]|uniref:Uncharacterized protein n=1 Tax=Megalops atlanticus TaxID=7932 RepID=A0A9D3PY33_MEGAT|nr:hypothetical protein MATL_G00123130 [Megalops atlanticus]
MSFRTSQTDTVNSVRTGERVGGSRFHSSRNAAEGRARRLGSPRGDRVLDRVLVPVSHEGGRSSANKQGKPSPPVLLTACFRGARYRGISGLWESEELAGSACYARSIAFRDVE